jgi:tetratricopeptide (TPR) repeat protein
VSSDRPVTTAREPARVPSARAGSSARAGGLPTGPGELAGFEILAELGRGAQSIVYRVRRPPSEADGATGGEFALKVQDQNPGDAGGPGDSLVAFHREAALLASVDHPGLTRVHEVGVAQGRPYLVMDLVDGVALATILADGPMPVERVIALGLDIVDPLAAVHRRGLVHRDLKPPNIMVQTDGVARLIDFGLTARGGTSDAGDAGGTVAVGTLAYSAPEQSGMLKRPVDNRSDLYSLGVILFEAVTGRLPFPSGDVGELLRMHAVVPAPDLQDLVPEAPRALADVVATLLAKDPDDRYQSGEALATDLRALAGDTRPAAAGRAPERFRGLSGRTAELGALHERWATAQAGRGGVCVVRGAGGTGKSRLAAELAGPVRAAGATVLWAATSPDDPVPFGPLRAALEDYLHAVGRAPVRERQHQEALIRAAAAGWSTAMLTRLAPGLEPVLRGHDDPARTTATGSPPPRSPGTAGPAAQRPAPAVAARPPGSSPAGPASRTPAVEADGQNQFVTAVAGFLTSLARECGALMLVVDDVQWLDPGSRRVLTQLGDQLAQAPMLVLVTAVDDEPSITRIRDFLVAMGESVDLDLTLGPLNQVGVADQIRSIMPGLAVDSRLVTLVFARCGGNPLIVEEYLRAIVDAGLLQPSWGTWVLDEEGLDALDLPQDAVGLVLARVQGIGAAARTLLATAAAMGGRFRAAALASAEGLDLDVVLESLAEATRSGLVEARDAGEFAFLHDRIRGVLLSDVDAEATADLHLRIARALEGLPVPPGAAGAEHVYAVAYHYTRCPPGTAVERVFASCWAAGQLALENHAPAEAVVWFEHAAHLGRTNPSNFLRSLGLALHQIGRLNEARERLEQALLVETTLLRRAEIFTMLAGVYRSNWGTEEGMRTIEQALSELGAPLPRNPVLLALSTLLMFVVAVLRQRTGIGFGAATGPRRERCDAFASLHNVGCYIGVINMRRDLMLVHNIRALYWTTQLGPGRRYAVSQSSFGMLCTVAGLTRTARRAFARADADPAAENPAVRAIVGQYHGAAAFLAHQDNGQDWIARTETDGPWLDMSGYLDAVMHFNAAAVAQGRTREAEYWLAQGRRRRGVEDGNVSSFMSAAPMTHALLGRFGEAGAELRRIEDLCAGYTARSIQVIRLLTSIFVLTEQGELGSPFDTAAAEFEALKIAPRRMIRTYRIIHFQLALGRLAQLRRADPDQRPAALIAARRAVEQVEKAAPGGELRAWARLARANLLILEDDPVRALTLLEQIPLFSFPDAPSIAFELARARARALTSLGADEARRQARLASSIALDQRWPHRAAAVAAEFALTPAERGGTVRPAVSAVGWNASGCWPCSRSARRRPGCSTRVNWPGWCSTRRSGSSPPTGPSCSSPTQTPAPWSPTWAATPPGRTSPS